MEPLPGAPEAPLIGADRWVTCAEYMPSVIVATCVVLEKPVTSAPGLTEAVAVQVRLGVPGMSTGSTSGYPPMPGVLPDGSEVNCQSGFRRSLDKSVEVVDR